MGILNNSRRNRHNSRRLRMEALETRVLMAIDIVWHNRGVTDTTPFLIPPYDGVDLEPDDADTPDNFNFVFQDQAEAARLVVDAALNDWERVINDFNDGNNTDNVFIVTIVADTTDMGCGGHARSPGGGSPFNGIPDEGTVVITSCQRDIDEDEIAELAWFIDPSPNESSEYLGTTFNAFAGSAPVGSAASIRSDIYTLIASEMAHVLGLDNDEDFLWEDLVEDNSPQIQAVGQVDQGISPGNLWRYDNGGVEALFTTNNGCDSDTATDTGFPIHIAEPDLNNTVNYAFGTYYGAQDVGNPCFSSGHRYLPSLLMTRVFAEVYGYSLPAYSSFRNMYTQLSAAGNLVVRGGSVGQTQGGVPIYAATGNSNDDFVLTGDTNSITVDVEIGTPVPGTGADTPFSRTFDKNDVSNISLFGYDGINLTGGDDTFRVDLSNGNWLPSGGMTIDGGNGSNVLEIFAPPDSGLEYTITGSQVVIDGIPINYVNITELEFTLFSSTSNNVVTFDEGTGGPLELYFTGSDGIDEVTILNTPASSTVVELDTRGGNDIVNVEGKQASHLVRIDMGNGDDAASLSPLAQDLDNILNSIVFQGEGGHDQLSIFDGNQLSGQNYRFTVEQSGLGRFDRMGLSAYFGTLEDVSMIGGQGNDHVDILGTQSNWDLAINTFTGDDTIRIDSNGDLPNGNVNTILSHVHIDGGDGTNGTDELTLFDKFDSTVNVVTITPTEVGAATNDNFFGAGGSLSYAGLSDMLIEMGRPGDSISIRGTAPGTETTVDGGLGNDSFVVASPPDPNQGGGDPDFGVVANVHSLLYLLGNVGQDTLFVNDTGAEQAKSVTFRDDSIGLGVSDTFFAPGGGLIYDSLSRVQMALGKHNDKVFVESTHVDTESHIQTGQGDDLATVSSPAGVVNDIRSALFVEGGIGHDALLVDDRLETSNSSITITESQIGSASSDTYLAPTGSLNYATWEQVEVLAGRGADQLLIVSTVPNTEMSVHGGDANDIFTVDSGNTVNLIRGPLSIDGGNGSGNSVGLNDQADGTSTTVTVTSSQVGAKVGDNLFGSGGSLTYTNLNELRMVTGLGNDQILLESTHAGTTALASGAGGNAFLVDSNGLASGGNANGIVGAVELVGGFGTNLLVVSDEDEVSDSVLTITPSNPHDGSIGFGTDDRFFGPGGKIKYREQDLISIRGGTGQDEFHATPSPTASGAPMSILGNNPASTTSARDVLFLDLNGSTNPELLVNNYLAGQFTLNTLGDLTYYDIERIDQLGGGPAVNVTLDVTSADLGGNDGASDRTELAREKTDLTLSVNATLALQIAESMTNSLAVLGSSDDNDLVVLETDGGLPRFIGQAPLAHSNPVFAASGLMPQTVGLHFDGGTGAGYDQIHFSISGEHDISKFDDLVGPAKSGVMNVNKVFTLSYENLTPITAMAFNSRLTVNAQLLNSMNVLVERPVGREFVNLSGDGGFETTVFPRTSPIDIVLPRGVEKLTGASGDFNDDGSYTCQDIDALVTTIAKASHDARYDMNADRKVDEADVNAWLTDAALLAGFDKPFSVGDANLDGAVDGSDFNIWHRNRFTENSGWCGGDFSLDGRVDATDLGTIRRGIFVDAVSLFDVPIGNAVARAMPARIAVVPRAPLPHEGAIAIDQLFATGGDRDITWNQPIKRDSEEASPSPTKSLRSDRGPSHERDTRALVAKRRATANSLRTWRVDGINSLNREELGDEPESTPTDP